MIEDEELEPDLDFIEEIEPTEEELDKYYEEQAEIYWKNKL